MSIAETAFRLLLPRGDAWALGNGGNALVRAVAKALERARVEAASIVAESRPGTATATTLKEWHAALGQKYDPTRDIATQRARLEAFNLSAGGATLERLQKQINLEFSGITVSDASADSECGADEAGVSFCGASPGDISPTFYDITGTVDTEDDVLRLSQIIAHFGQVHLIATINVTVISLSSTSEAGLAISGLDECGNDGT
jgi:Uncharacterized protein conserved in bacteria (DUF2313).